MAKRTHMYHFTGVSKAKKAIDIIFKNDENHSFESQYFVDKGVKSLVISITPKSEEQRQELLTLQNK